MITNDRQYKITKTQIQNFQDSLDSRSIVSTENIHPKLLEAHKNAIDSQLHDLMRDVAEYEALKAGQTVVAEVKDLKDLPLALIKSRIANGLTQSELAKKLGLKEQQVQRYESENYESASLKTLLKIAAELKISLNADVQIKEVTGTDDFNVRDYPFKQMFQRRWFKDFSGSLNEAVKNSADLVASLFNDAGIDRRIHGLTKRSVRTGSVFNEFALNAWYARVIIKAKQLELPTTFSKNVITEQWLKSLAALSRLDDGPIQATQYLKNSGIAFVYEPKLDGTFLDGAALLVENNLPIIAMTLRHDRIDNFWFVLFHEVAHIYLHLGAELDAIFDDFDIKIDGIEKEADAFALNSLVPDDVWKKSLVRFSPSNETITNLAVAQNIHPALVAGRIRRETGKYYQFNDLIGQGELRPQFEKFLNN